MKIVKQKFMAVVLSLAGLMTGLGAGTALAADSSLSFLAPEKRMEGVIQELDFGANTMIFQGVRIHMAPDVQVEIRGSHGAFTMLKVGMKASVTYRVISPSLREAVKVEQLPDNTRIEGV